MVDKKKRVTTNSFLLRVRHQQRLAKETNAVSCRLDGSSNNGYVFANTIRSQVLIISYVDKDIPKTLEYGLIWQIFLSLYHYVQNL